MTAKVSGIAVENSVRYDVQFLDEFDDDDGEPAVHIATRHESGRWTVEGPLRGVDEAGLERWIVRDDALYPLQRHRCEVVSVEADVDLLSVDPVGAVRVAVQQPPIRVLAGPR